MEGVTRLYENKEVLYNIWLSFYPGAKIGVLGANGPPAKHAVANSWPAKTVISWDRPGG